MSEPHCCQDCRYYNWSETYHLHECKKVIEQKLNYVTGEMMYSYYYIWNNKEHGDCPHWEAKKKKK